MYIQDMKLKSEEIFLPFKILCRTKKIETLVLEGDNPASALLSYITVSGIRSLVLGSCSSSCISCFRKAKSSSVPSVVLQRAPEACNIYVVSRHRLIKSSTNPLLARESSSRHWLFPQKEHCSHSASELEKSVSCYLVESEVNDALGTSSSADLSHINTLAIAQEISSTHSTGLKDVNYQNLGINVPEVHKVQGCHSVASTDTKQSYVEAEVEQLRLELVNAVSMYNRACEDLVHAQNKVCMLSSECLDEAKQVNAALEREEFYRKVAAEEKEKHLEAVKEIEIARNRLAKEAYERQIAELRALKEAMERKKIVDSLFSNDNRYKKYTRNEIEIATGFFSESNKIGEGSYGRVYRCNLDNTPVAVKVLQPDASDKKDEFLKEIEVLSQLRHPNIVLLLGACPETGSLVYEYMENGSLEDHILRRSGTHPLPWFVRFRIAFEVACGIAFLHNSKPEPIVHRDLKPGNVFLDRNYVSKIGDAGLAKLISDAVPDNITEYRDSLIAGTFHYMDPEYQRTGTVRPKSDLYAFGIIVLQLLAGRQPNGLLLTVENAIANGSLSDILDKSIPDWPLAEAQELAHVALKCSRLRCRDRPDLETEVLPVLKNLADFADAYLSAERNSIDAPSHYFCPILQEVMDDPHIAADGFTYEHRAIKTWLERHNISPVSKLRLPHAALIPNHTLRSAIQEWRSQVRSPNV
ncbi:U-box domain-containing protein 34-like isoform X2 [Diospyros lotus]|nr:U-box domain-containing protein 34-like isoform X2 [Diospyros lotus]XP_052199672.1 U-box domain-containing protein 34-like isoform X2 [Diospyros lotus]